MGKRPLSLTIIAVILIVLAVLGVIFAAMIGSNAAMAAKIAEMHVSLRFVQAQSVIGAIVIIACAYGILKGLPWSRVVYLVWGIIGLVVGAYTSPNKAGLVVNLIVLVVICIFLWTNNANDWFAARGFMLKRERAR